MKNYNDDIFYSTWSYVGANVTKYGGALLGITETIGSDHSLNSLGVIALSGGLFIGGTLWDRFTTRVQSLKELKALKEDLENLLESKLKDKQ